MNESKATRTEWLSMAKLAKCGNGLVRLGMYEHRLLDWSRLLMFSGMPFWLQALWHAFDTKGDEAANVMGLVKHSIPLSDFDAVQEFKPRGGKTPDDTLQGKWVPMKL